MQNLRNIVRQLVENGRNIASTEGAVDILDCTHVLLFAHGNSISFRGVADIKNVPAFFCCVLILRGYPSETLQPEKGLKEEILSRAETQRRGEDGMDIHEWGRAHTPQRGSYRG